MWGNFKEREMGDKKKNSQVAGQGILRQNLLTLIFEFSGKRGVN